MLAVVAASSSKPPGIREAESSLRPPAPRPVGSVSYWLVPVGLVEVVNGSLRVVLSWPIPEVGLVDVDNGSLPLVLLYPLVEVGSVDDERGSAVRLFPK